VLARRSGLAALGRSVLADRAIRLQPLAARLTALDPHAVLSRGYALALDRAGRAVTRAARLQVGERLRLVLAVGSAGVQVSSVDSDGPGDNGGRQ
jgi:exodeoxyribonuclease VII large subunit